MKSDLWYLEQALELTKRSSEPLKCATVIVLDGVIVAAAHNSQREDKQAVNHAEIKALQIANRRTQTRKLKGATVYCSCEPCAMCLVALSLAEVERVVYAQTMQQLAPDDDLSKLDIALFAKTYLKHAPKLEHVVVS